LGAPEAWRSASAIAFIIQQGYRHERMVSNGVAIDADKICHNAHPFWRSTMLHTHVCELLGIEFPVIQAGMGLLTSAELVAAVSNAGGLGSLGAGLRSTADLKQQLVQTRELTQRPFAVNHLLSMLNEEAFTLTLDAKPSCISFALADPGNLVQRAHDAGILVMHQVTTVQQARQAAERGVDVIIAQGSEAGGFGGTVAGLALIPQVVDAVRPIPVIAAGGIADGRGLAAALVLGAQGINMGTRFLASREVPISEGWKQAILAATSEEAVKVEGWTDLMRFHPLLAAMGGAYGAVPRALRTPFLTAWLQRRDDATQDVEDLQAEVKAAVTGRLTELMPLAGQTAGMIRDILPAAEIIRRIVAEAEEALKRTAKLLG
jgi:nitronate monooxygenase/enoyl-[acyl-carrier protein] reductase II